MKKRSLELSRNRNYLGCNMTWTTEETSQFQKENNAALQEVNATLQPDKNLSGKIGIFLPGQAGDLTTAMSVLKYRDKIFPGKEIIWFVNSPNCDLLRFAPISEVRPYPWAGNGLPEGTPDFFPMLCNDQNRLNQDLKNNFDLTKDLEDGYFPTPWMLSPEKRHGIDYANVSRKVFGVPDDWEWHPLLSFSEGEKLTVSNFMQNHLPSEKKYNIMMETFCGSGQSILDEEMVIQTMETCERILGSCKFIFASHKYLKDKPEYPENFFNKNIISCAHFTVRQCALVNDYCDLFVGISSGISVATSCWGSKKVSKIQFCGSMTCSTVALANGTIDLVTADDKTPEVAKSEFYDKLKSLLEKIKW